MKKKLLILGAGGFGEILCSYFKDAGKEVAGFAVDRHLLDKTELLGLPVVAIETIEERFPSAEHDVFVAVTFFRLNRDRARLFELVKKKGYNCSNYVSPHAYLDKNVKLGENVCVFENCIIQYGCSIGDNTILWSGSNIGHGSALGKHVFLAAGVVLAGWCKIGDYSFLGVNSAVGHRVNIGQDCTLGAGSSIVKDIADNSYIRPQKMNVKENCSRSLWDSKKFSI